MAAILTQELASRFARIALGQPWDARTPRELHPLFFGSFDWHSCVHGYWLLCRLYRRFPGLPERSEIHSLLDRHFTSESVQGELDYFRTADAFERPYGWAWLLMLASELALQEDAAGRRWGGALAPLAEFLADSSLSCRLRPIRCGAGRISTAPSQ